MPVNNTIVVRKGSSAEWTATNPILSIGELGFDVTNKIFKVGDGTSTWSTLQNTGDFSSLFVNRIFSSNILEITAEGSDIFTYGAGLFFNDTLVSLDGHTHSSSEITDFNSSVSGLLPVKDIISGTGIIVSSNSGIYTIDADIISIYEFTRSSAPPDASGSLGSYTWSLPTNAKLVEIFMLGGGGGGGSGRRGASATNRYGGGGGGSAGSILVTIDASLITTPLTISVATGGAGGASVTTDNTNGNGGSFGGISSITFNNSVNTLFRAFGGLGASGGTGSAGTGGPFTSNSATTFRGSTGQSAALSNLTTVVPGDRAVNGPAGIPGAAGGSISTGDVVFTPGSVRNDAPYFAFNSGQTGADTSGGTASITSSAGSGSNAASYGYGGCGGGASANGFSSGAGGNGGQGYVRIIVWY